VNLFEWLGNLFQPKKRDSGASAPGPAPARGRDADRALRIGGKRFRVVQDGTAERDHFVIQYAGKVGLREVAMLEAEDPEAFAHRLLYQLVDAGVVFELLGGILIPDELEDSEWTLELARSTAAHLRRCHLPEDKATINAAIGCLIQDFFVRGVSSLVSSRTVSGRALRTTALSGTVASENGVS